MECEAHQARRTQCSQGAVRPHEVNWLSGHRVHVSRLPASGTKGPPPLPGAAPVCRTGNQHVLRAPSAAPSSSGVGPNQQEPASGCLSGRGAEGTGPACRTTCPRCWGGGAGHPAPPHQISSFSLAGSHPPTRGSTPCPCARGSRAADPRAANDAQLCGDAKVSVSGWLLICGHRTTHPRRGARVPDSTGQRPWPSAPETDELQRRPVLDQQWLLPTRLGIETLHNFKTAHRTVASASRNFQSPAGSSSAARGRDFPRCGWLLLRNVCSDCPLEVAMTSRFKAKTETLKSLVKPVGRGASHRDADSPGPQRDSQGPRSQSVRALAWQSETRPSGGPKGLPRRPPQLTSPRVHLFAGISPMPEEVPLEVSAQ